MNVTFGANIGYFLWSLLAGLVLAVLYDVLRLMRRIVKAPDAVVTIEDILFLIISGGVIVAVAYAVNNGIFRIYSLLSTGLGFVMYRAVVGRRLVNVFFMIYSGICKALAFAVKVLMFPVRLAVRVIGRPVFITICSAARGGAGKVRGRVRRVRQKDGGNDDDKTAECGQ